MGCLGICRILKDGLIVQITNILLGLGLPYTVSNLGGNAVEVHAGHIQTIATVCLKL